MRGIPSVTARARARRVRSVAPLARQFNGSACVASVDIQSVKKRFGEVEVLHGVDIVIADGSFTVLVGPSGCGKSTLLRMIAGLENISSGEIRIAGRVVNQVPPKERDIAMVFQNYALYPHMTVRDNMAFSLNLAKTPKAAVDARVKQAAGILGLEALLDRFPRQLSGGQRQRVAMGRAIVRDPQVFLFDEPLSNLDAKLRVQMRTEIKELHQRLKTTSIYVTHDQIEAMTMADQIVVMHDGRVEQIGNPLKLYDHPVNRFVAGFIGSPAMNFIEGRLSGGFVEAANGARLPAPRAGSSQRRPAGGLRHPPRTPGHCRRRLRRRGRGGRAHRLRDPVVRAPRAAGAGGRVPRASRVPARAAHPVAPARRLRAPFRPDERPTDLSSRALAFLPSIRSNPATGDSDDRTNLHPPPCDPVRRRARRRRRSGNLALFASAWAQAAPWKPEAGAQIQLLRWKRFVQSEEDSFMALVAAFTKATGVEVKVINESLDDVQPKASVAANTNQGPDMFWGLYSLPHLFPAKCVDVSDVADFLGKKYGGWVPTARPTARAAASGSRFPWPTTATSSTTARA